MSAAYTVAVFDLDGGAFAVATLLNLIFFVVSHLLHKRLAGCLQIFYLSSSPLRGGVGQAIAAISRGTAAKRELGVCRLGFCRTPGALPRFADAALGW